MKIDPKKLLKFCLIAIAILKILLITKMAFTCERMFFEIITLPLSIVLLHFGIKLDYFLQKSPKFLLNFIIFYFSFEVFILLPFESLDFLTGFISFYQYLIILSYIFGIILLGRYLINAIKKLSTQNTIIEYKGYRKIILIFVLLTMLYLFLIQLQSNCSIGYVGGAVGGSVGDAIGSSIGDTTGDADPFGQQHWDGFMCVPFWEVLH